ncbi:cytochrome P450 [Actinocrispum sp. NPDC049592]|uniref:cytochrome P450 n=1 Tax=Actinocrispum sp. NPDC049592 TaxID=3154835 RepID=UPI0034219CCB
MIRTHTATGDPAWMATEYAEVRRLLSDERLGRSHPEPEKAGRTGDSALFGGPMGNFETEQADHARMRALLQPHFSAKHMRALRPRIQSMAAELIDDLRSPADLQAAVATPLPIMVICELLGVPYEDRDQFRAWSEAAGTFTDRDASAQGLAALYGYGLSLVAKKRVTPGDDVISRLCETETDEAAAQLSMALLFAGHETTVVRIGMALMMLLAEPGEWQRLAADPSLIPAAIEETLRWPTELQYVSHGGLPRYARTDFTVGDAQVRTGDLVLLNLSGANQDPSVFPDPKRFDTTRDATGHLTFGHGIRYCLGAPLARIELQEVLGQLIPRHPGMRLAVPVEQLRYRTETLTGGLIELPVTWE